MLRQGWRAWLPAFAALALVDSDAATPPPERETPRKMPEPIVSEVQPISKNPPDVTLTCTVERQERGIRIHYLLSNQSSELIFRFGLGQVMPNGKVVHPVDLVCDAGAGSVNIVLGISPDPIVSRMYGINHFPGQKPIALGPAENVADTIDLALPLLEWDHFNSGTGWSEFARTDQAVFVHLARLIVDFVRPDRKGYDPDHPGRSAESVWCAAPVFPQVTLLRHPGLGELGDPARWPAFHLGPGKAQTREAAVAGHRELREATEQHRAHYTAPRRRGTSPADMPRQRQ